MVWKTPIKGTIAGKRMVVLDGGQRPCHLRDLQRHMGKFPTRDMLAYIGKVAAAVEAVDDGIPRIGGVPVPFHCLPYLALLSIECSNDHRGEAPTDGAFARAVEMFINLPSPIQQSARQDGNEAAGIEYLLRLGGQQFDFQGELRHLLPRTLLMFRDLWPTVDKAKDVAPLEDIRKITGNDLVQNILFGLRFFIPAQSGYFRPYGRPPTQDPLPEIFKREPLRGVLDADAETRFLDWVSASYTQIRKLARQVVLDDTYDPYRFNPLIRYPVVRPDLQPPGGDRPVYLVPVGRLLWERVTRGLYHDLARHHDAGGGANSFRVAFGHVFQDYVGLLLREALGPERLRMEWRYHTPSGQRDTPDWVVLDGDRAVIVEVKQSALFLDAKKSGDIHLVEADLRKTLAKAARQLTRFQADVSHGTEGLKPLAHVTSFEQLIVTWDRVSWGNSLVRNAINIANQGTGDLSECRAHIVAIDELEYLLGYCWKGSLFDLLQKKRLAPDGQDSMDFHDWVGQCVKGSEAAPANPFLNRMFNECLEAWGLPPVGAT